MANGDNKPALAIVRNRKRACKAPSSLKEMGALRAVTPTTLFPVASRAPPVLLRPGRVRTRQRAMKLLSGTRIDLCDSRRV